MNTKNLDVKTLSKIARSIENNNSQIQNRNTLKSILNKEIEYRLSKKGILSIFKSLMPNNNNFYKLLLFEKNNETETLLKSIQYTKIIQKI